jgi:hypothetical protein
VPKRASNDGGNGRIRQPDTEIVVVGPGVSRIERLAGASTETAPRRSIARVFRALLRGALAILGRRPGPLGRDAQATRTALRLGSTAGSAVPVPPELMGGRREIALLDLSRDRPHLTLVPGMEGTIEIGVSRLDAAAILGDPRLRGPSGEATYPLPWGARACIVLGPWRFTIRPVVETAGAR